MSDPIALIETTTQINGPELARAAAQENFNNAERAIIRINTPLTEVERQAFKAYTGLSVLSTQKAKKGNDHILLQAANEVVESRLESQFPVQSSFGLTLHVGATVKEIKKWWGHTSHEFYLHLGEDKDYARVVEGLLDLLGSKLKRAKLANLRNSKERDYELTLSGLDEAISMLETATGTRRRIHLSLPREGEGSNRKYRQYTSLIFSDSLYSIRKAEFLSYFRKTGAVNGYGKIFAPDEFLAADYAPSTIYKTETSYLPLEFEKLWESIWPSALGFSALIPIEAMEHVIKKVVVYFMEKGPETLGNWITGALATPMPIVTLLGNMFDVMKFLPVVRQLFDFIKAKLDKAFRYISVGWKGGFSSGYKHHWYTWQRYVTRRRASGGDIVVDWEVKARVGEMYLLHFYRSRGQDEIVYSAELPVERRVVRVARLMSAFNQLTGKFDKTPDTFCVREADWFKVLNWALAEPIESLDPGVVMTTIVRAKGGLSLNSAVIVLPMNLQDADTQDFAMAIIMETYSRRNLMDQMDNNKESLTNYETNIARLLKYLTVGVASMLSGGIVVPLYHIFRWMVETHAPMNFVTYPGEPPLKTERKIRRSNAIPPRDQRLHVRLPTEKKLAPTGCVMCDLQRSGTFAIGKDMTSTQQFITSHRDNRPQQLGLSTVETTELLTKVRDSRHFHTGKAGPKLLGGIKKFEDWVESQLGSGIEANPTVHYIEGGPGTGKSVIVREMAAILEDAGQSVSVLIPFTKLAADYMNSKLLNSSKPRTFLCDTTWWATLRGAVDVLFVDEFTAVDELYLRGLCAYLGVKELYLVGDVHQTCLDQSAGEGCDPSHAKISDGGKWNWDEISKHTLVWNWRNPPWCVKAMNEAFGFQMLSKRTDLSKHPRVITRADYRAHYEANNKMELVFAHRSAEIIFGKQSTASKADADAVNMSVRSSQGTTATHVAVSAADGDEATMDVHGQMLVAFSRHKEELVYVGAEAADCPSGNKVARFFGFDTPENIARIERLPWPQIKMDVPEPKLTEEQIALGRWLKQKQQLGELVQAVETPEEAGKEEVDVVELQPGKIKITMLHEKTDKRKRGDLAAKRVDEDLSYLAQTHNFCLLDAVEIQILNLEGKIALRRAVRDGLAKRFKKANKGSVDKHWEKAPNGKYNIPIDAFLNWLEPTGLPVVVVCEDLDCRTPRVFATTNAGDSTEALQVSVWESHAEPRDASEKIRKVAVIREDIKGETTWLRWNDQVDGVYVHFLPWRQRRKDRGYVVEKPASAGFSVPSVRRANDNRTGDRFWDARALGHGGPTSSYVAVDAPNYVTKPRVGSKYRGGTDAFRLMNMLDSSGAILGPAAANYAAMVRGAHRPGLKNDLKPSFEGLIHDRTAGGKIKPRKSKEYRSFLVGTGNHFNNTPIESLTAAHRLGQKRPKPRLTAESKAYAERIATAAYFDHWYPNYVLDELEVNATVEKALRDMKARSYAKRANGEIKKRGWRPLLTFSNKDQFKPIKDGKLDLGKSGQGILQSPAYIAAEFAPWMRVNNLHFKRAAKDHFHYDNLVSAEEFSQSLTSALRQLPPAATYGIADGEEFDSWQNEVTLHCEKYFRYLQGAASPTIAAYYEIRGPQEFTMFGCFRGRTNFEKGSGFLDTLLGNTTLQAIAGTQLFIGQGPKVVAAKGDDFLHVQANLRLDEERKDRLEHYLGMRWKTNADSSGRIRALGGEFCGNVVSGGGCYPSIARAATKALASKAKTYKHFCEQQQAYREKVKGIIAGGLEECIASNVVAEKKPECVVRAYFDVLNSLGHIGKAQWEQWTAVRKNPLLLPCAATGPVMF